MKIYIVARPYDEIEEFIPMYVTNHKEKAQTFWHGYNDESIQMVIFSKDWEPNDPNNFPNILFNYLDGDLSDTQLDGMMKHNTLYGKYKEFIEMDEEEAEKYWSGDPDEELSKSGFQNPKIWEL